MNRITINFLLCCFFLFLQCFGSSYAQTNVAITIDDVPNTRLFKQDNFKSILLQQLEENNIPTAIFINEGLIYKNNPLEVNQALLEQWIKKDFITCGNHSFSHQRYSAVGLDAFKKDIEKGEAFSKQLAAKYNKSYQYFRLPYNDLGKNEQQQQQLDSLLTEKGYVSTPFTFESSDWMFNFLYEYYLKKGENEEALEIGNLYVEKTIDCFMFFDSLSQRQFGRKINQIYLCHDNAINAAFLKDIIAGLKQRNCRFTSLEEALKDPVYEKENKYNLKWGVSWFYRWMSDQKERVKLMKQEPDLSQVNNLYNELSKTD